MPKHNPSAIIPSLDSSAFDVADIAPSTRHWAIGTTDTLREDELLPEAIAFLLPDNPRVHHTHE
jgi:hypothetical protein